MKMYFTTTGFINEKKKSYHMLRKYVVVKYTKTLHINYA